jgi:hypothetical protein
MDGAATVGACAGGAADGAEDAEHAPMTMVAAIATPRTADLLMTVKPPPRRRVGSPVARLGPGGPARLPADYLADVPRVPARERGPSMLPPRPSWADGLGGMVIEPGPYSAA